MKKINNQLEVNAEMLKTLNRIDLKVQEVIESDWLHNYQKRIVVNPQILFVAEAVNEILGMFALISIRGLPQEETEEGIIHIYVNEIKPAEAYIVEKWGEYITVCRLPKVAN